MVRQNKTAAAGHPAATNGAARRRANACECHDDALAPHSAGRGVELLGCRYVCTPHAFSVALWWPITGAQTHDQPGRKATHSVELRPPCIWHLGQQGESHGAAPDQRRRRALKPFGNDARRPRCSLCNAATRRGSVQTQATVASRGDGGGGAAAGGARSWHAAATPGPPLPFAATAVCLRRRAACTRFHGDSAREFQRAV